MTDIRELFFSLLRISVGRKEDFPALGADQWEQIYNLAKSHALIGVVFSAIESLPQEVMPEKQQLIQFYAQANYISHYNEKVSGALRRVYSRVVGDGFDCVVLKGQGAALGYRIPESRNPGDIDLWCPSKLGRAVRYVRGVRSHAGSGGGTGGVSGGRSGGVSGGMKVFYHHVEFGKADGIEVEFHVRPTWLNSPLRNSRLQKFFDSSFSDLKANVRDFGGIQVAFPTVSFNLVFMPVHIYRHLFAEGIGLRQLMDLYYVLISSEASERTRAFEVLCSVGMKRFAGALMWVMQRVFAMEDEFLLCPPSAADGRFLLREIMIAGNFGQSDTRFVMTPAGKMRRLLLFLTSYPSEVLWAPFFKLWQILFIRLPYNLSGRVSGGMSGGM